jgi:putative DNA primase/helicase
MNTQNINQHDVIEQFKDFALNSAGIKLPADLNPDGQLHRFKINGDKANSLNGAYTLHLDGNKPAGFLQDWSGEKYNWEYDNPDYTPVQLTPEQRKQQAEEQRQKKELKAKAEADKHAQAAIKARKEWNAAKIPTSTDNHDYAVKKSVQLHHARLSEFNGVSQLIIPVQNSTGDIVSIQRIKPDGSKMLFSGGRKQGGYSILNPQNEPQIIAIGEGFATVASVIEDSYCVENSVMGVMAIDAGNLEQVAIAMREQYPTADIFLFGDKGDVSDIGENLARAAAIACNGFCVLPPIEKGDFNDYLTGGAVSVSLESLILVARGYDVNADYDDSIPYTAEELADRERAKSDKSDKSDNSKPAPRLFTPIGVLIKNQVCVSWVIRDYLPLNSTCMTYGESGAGKTFFTLDMALHIACGKQWQEHKTKQGAVFYVAGEGQTGIAARAMAWALHHDVNLENVPFYCTDGAIVPTNEGGHFGVNGAYVKGQIDLFFDDIDAWIESTGETPMLIIFDTLARCFDGNENSSQDAGAYIKAKDRIKKKYGCCVMSIHHTGKDTGAGARGSSAFKGAWDAEHCLSVKDGNIELSTPKMKEREKPAPKAFRLESVNTGWFDDDNEPVYSAVMVASDYVPTKKEKPLTDRQRDILSELHKAIELHGVEPTSEIKVRFPDSTFNTPKKVVSKEKWRDLAFPLITTNNKSQTFNACTEQLLALGKVGYYDGFYWIGY